MIGIDLAATSYRARRRLRLLALVASLIGVLVGVAPLTIGPAPTASALTTLFSTIGNGPPTVQGVNTMAVGPYRDPSGTTTDTRAAMAFIPTASGTAQLLTMRGRCVIGYPTTTTCQSVGTVTIQSDAGGKPSGQVLGTMGFYLTDSLSSGTPVMKECGTLSPAPELTKGFKYWAVMSAQDYIGWSFWSEDSAEILQSVDGGAWGKPPFIKTPALRIDSGADECVPVADANPVSGTTIRVRDAFQTFNTLTITNTGVTALTLSGATFTGTGASAFALRDGQFGQPMRFPRTVGVGTTLILYTTCSDVAADGFHMATLKIPTSDPSQPELTYPVECRVDTTPPSVKFTEGQPNGQASWWKTTPVTLGVNASDPPGQQVTELGCRDDNPGAELKPDSVAGRALSMSVRGEGEHRIGCSATDNAGNTSSYYETTLRIDSRPPTAAARVSPAPNDDGWNNNATTVSFTCDDPAPGSGIVKPATGGGSVAVETAGTQFSSAGCTDLVGHSATPATVTVKTDWTAPIIDGATVTPAPNAAGWNDSDVFVSFHCADAGTVQSSVKSFPTDVAVTQETAGRTITSSDGCTDRAGNKAPAGASALVKIDKTDPSTELDSAPPAATNLDQASFTFHGADTLSGIARFECRLDGGSYEACADSGVTYSDLADGEHTVSVRAVDVAGNIDRTPETRTWTVNTTFFALDDTASTLEDASTSIGVVDNDITPNGVAVVALPSGPRSAHGGTVTAAADGTLSYVPPPDFQGTDTLKYALSTDEETTDVATVTVTVDAVNDQPEFSPGGLVTVAEDSGRYEETWATDMTAGPAEPDQGLRFGLSGNSNPGLFSVAPALSPAGVLTFTPAPDANGIATVEVRLVDDGGTANGGVDTSEPVLLTIRVRGIDDAPTIAVLPALECAASGATLHVQVHDVDNDDSALTVSPLVSGAAIGATSTGSGASRSVNLSGIRARMRATVTLGVSDGIKQTSRSLAMRVGTARPDTLTGSNGADVLLGRGADDVLRGGAANDLICGDAGADRIEGGAGSDAMRGGLGADFFAGASGQDTILDFSTNQGDRR